MGIENKYNFVDFKDENNDDFTGLIQTIPYDKDARDFDVSGLRVIVIGKGLIVRNEMTGVNKKYEMTDDFITHSGDLVGLKQYRDKKGNLQNAFRFAVRMDKMDPDDGYPSFTLDNIRVIRNEESNSLIIVIICALFVFGAAYMKYGKSFRAKRRASFSSRKRKLV